jgi:hypothetical protein
LRSVYACKAPVIRYYKGQKKHRGTGETAPWDGSLYEKESLDTQKQSEYNNKFYAKPGQKAQKIVPGQDNRSWMIGDINQKMNNSSSYVQFYPANPIDNSIAYRPREQGVIYQICPKQSQGQGQPVHETEHSVEFHDEKFGQISLNQLKRKNEREDENSNESTMKRDFREKKLTQKAQPFRPTLGLNDTLGADAAIGPQTSSNKHDYVKTDFKMLEMVKNCKPVRKFTPPTVPMECATNAMSEYTDPRTRL